MALIKNYFQPQFLITITNCYWKVEVHNGINGGKNNIRCRLNCFKNKSDADQNKNKYANFDFQFVPDLESTDNFIAQAYFHVKLLPEFANAVDA